MRCGAFTHPGCYQPTFHYDCPHNQIRSLVGRVAGVVPQPTKAGLARLYKTKEVIARCLPRVAQAPLENMPNRYVGAKRQTYLNALREYYHYGLDRSHSSVKFFVKAERFNPLAKTDPDPRAIQFRGPRYAVVLASYLQPIEHLLYLSTFASSGVEPTRNIAKGLNSIERAKLLVRKHRNFDDPVVVSLDASRFDKHVSLELLRLEHAIYLACNSCPTFARLLSWQLINKGYSRLGLKYVLRGRRMSGDMNTAIGNCLLMLLMLTTYCHTIGLKKWDSLDDGDDCCLLIERRDLALVLGSVKEVFLDYGMEMKIDHVAYSIPQVLFCRSNPIEYLPGHWKYVRNYIDVLSKSLTGVRHWESVVYRRRVLRAIGLCELVLSLGVPVLQDFALFILRNVNLEEYNLDLAPLSLATRTKKDLGTIGLPIQRIQPRPILDCARVSFETAFGLTIFEQRRLEDVFKRLTFDPSGNNPLEHELGPGWTWTQTLNEILH